MTEPGDSTLVIKGPKKGDRVCVMDSSTDEIIFLGEAHPDITMVGGGAVIVNIPAKHTSVVIRVRSLGSYPLETEKKVKGDLIINYPRQPDPLIIGEEE